MRDAHAEGLTSAKPFHFSLENSKTSLAYYGTPDILERCYYRANGLDFQRPHLNRQLNERRLSRLAPTVEWLNEASGSLRDARMRATV